MRLFLKKLLLFFLPLIILSYPIDIIISKLISNQEDVSIVAGEFSVWNDIVKGKINADILIYGSSRAWVQFDSKKIQDATEKRTYNLGIDGHNFLLQHLRHKMYLKLNQKPKTIIISVDYSTLTKRPDLYNYSQFLPYMLWNKDIKEYISKYEGFDRADYYVPLLRYTGEFRLLSKSLISSLKKKNVKRVNGFLAQELVWNDDFDNAKKNNKKVDSEIDTDTLSLFDNFLSECKNDNINVILVFAPIFHEGLAYIKNYNKLDKVFDNLAKKYGSLYLNYTKNPICLDKNNFYNATHLNKRGTEVFNELLISDFLKEN